MKKQASKQQANIKYSFFAQLLYTPQPQTKCRICFSQYPKGEGHTCPSHIIIK